MSIVGLLTNSESCPALSTGQARRVINLLAPHGGRRFFQFSGGPLFLPSLNARCRRPLNSNFSATARGYTRSIADCQSSS
jgi:hypothetical protein